MKIGEKVVIPQNVADIGGQSAVIIRVENNSFVGNVITVETADGSRYFDREYQFRPV